MGAQSWGLKGSDIQWTLRNVSKKSVLSLELWRPEGPNEPCRAKSRVPSVLETSEESVP